MPDAVTVPGGGASTTVHTDYLLTSYTYDCNCDSFAAMGWGGRRNANRTEREAAATRGWNMLRTHQAGDAFTLMLSGAALRLPDSVRLLALEFDFAAALDAVQRGDKPDPPQPKPTCYGVARSRFRVHAHVLQRWQFAFLRACGTQGAPLHGAADAAAVDSGRDAAALRADLLLWLPAAFEAGFLTMAT